MLGDLTNDMGLLYWIDRRNRAFSGGVFLSFPVFAAEATHYQRRELFRRIEEDELREIGESFKILMEK